MNLFENAFISVLNMTITASYAALAVIVARMLLRKSPRVFSYGLWSVVFFRLLCPFSFSSRFSLIGYTPQYIPPEIGMMEAPAVETGLNGVNTVINSSFPAAVPWASVNPLQIWITLGTIVWLSGVAVLLIYAVVSCLRLQKQISTATLIAGNIYESDLIESPFVCGLIRPKIYLPLSLTGAEQEYILRHEEIHIRRLDYLIKPLAFLALALHWFNPLLWLCYALMTKDMEMSCDEQVIQSSGGREAAGYSSSLLALARRRRMPCPSPLAFGESNVKARIKNVLNYKRPSFGVIVVSFIAVIILATVLLSNPPNESIPANDKGEKSAYDVEALLENKTPYIGNNSRVMALINALPLPEGVTREAVKLQTSATPYGVTINYRLEDDSLKIGEEQFLRNSLLLFALIDNAGEVTHHGYWNNKLLSSIPFRYTYTRADAERVVGGDIRQFARNQESLAELVEIVGMLKK